MLGGLGSCGRELCCSSFLGDFEPVSIRMAKDQNLSLNPAKISGICGRLMCCLKYENGCYESKNGQKDQQEDNEIFSEVYDEESKEELLRLVAEEEAEE